VRVKPKTTNQTVQEMNHLKAKYKVSLIIDSSTSRKASWYLSLSVRMSENWSQVLLLKLTLTVRLNYVWITYQLRLKKQF